ncbi:phasin family protein [Methylobacterium durans]|uniref:Phasin n=1 Tax=Methylobacterium durans TaxID=2202825 RepID=A0A2U8WB79_9HYPH|nr:phasin family protein [Methylobacterium durans]AWN42700.1 phasin [Methylobacterium durans]
MAFNQNSNQNKQSEQSDKAADTAKATLDRTAEQGKQFADATRDGVNKMVDLSERASENTKQIVQRSVETASQQAREAGARFTKTLGFTGEDSERLARQSKQNIEAVARCGTVLTQAFQDASRSWFGLAQSQVQRNLDGLNKLTRAKSVQEFAAIQSELARESLQHIVQDSRAITETSTRAVEEASKAFASVAQTPTIVR